MIIEAIGAQGEVRIYRLDRMPTTGEPVARTKGGFVIGHSETGHHHVLVAERATVFRSADAPAGMRILFALLESPGTLEHLRQHDTHAPHSLEPGAYMFRTDREFDHYAELARAAAD